MRTINKIAAQGELMVLRVDEIPDGVEAAKAEDGKLVVGHSETGHNHAIEAVPQVQLFNVPENELERYIKVGMPFADLVHLRGYDAHETLRLPEGNYRIRRQREHSIEGWVPVLD